MNKSEHFDVVDRFVKEHSDEFEINLFNGEWCVRIFNLPHPWCQLPVEKFYLKYVEDGK